MKITRRRTRGGWTVVDPDGRPLIVDETGKPRLFAVPEQAVVAGNDLGQTAWKIRRLS